MSDIEQGAVVNLKSGGPDMTVQSAQNPAGILCQWFNEQCQLQFGQFPAASLKVRRLANGEAPK